MTHRRLPTLGFALRLLLTVACVLPFTGVTSASAFVVVGHAPAGPVTEEDERQEEAVAKERAAHERQQKPGRPGTVILLPVHRSSVLRTSGPSRPTAPDPFNNGLGTPFRC
jgi:hypothetical protein